MFLEVAKAREIENEIHFSPNMSKEVMEGLMNEYEILMNLKKPRKKAWT